MAQVTVELGRLLDQTNFELFDFEYSFDDLQFKQTLEQSVIDFYYDYEIGQETPDMFKRKFKTRWLRAMSYYNELYNTTLLTYNPLTNYKIDEAMEQLANSTNIQDSTATTTTDGTTDVTGSTTDDSTTEGTNTRTDNTTSATNSTRTDDLTQMTDSNEKTSDYPQQPIAGGDFLNGERISTQETSNIGTVDSDSTTTNTGTVGDSGTSTTTAGGTNTSLTTSEDSSDTTANTTATGVNDMNYTKSIEGITGTTYQELVQKQRNNILRITNMVIEEMKPCFILVH